MRLLLGPGRVMPAESDRRSIEIVDFVTFDDLQRRVREGLEAWYDWLRREAAAVSDAVFS